MFPGRRKWLQPVCVPFTQKYIYTDGRKHNSLAPQLLEADLHLEVRTLNPAATTASFKPIGMRPTFFAPLFYAYSWTHIRCYLAISDNFLTGSSDPSHHGVSLVKWRGLDTFPQLSKERPRCEYNRRSKRSSIRKFGKKARSILVYSKGRTWRDCFFRNHLCSVTCNFTAWTT